MDTKPLACSSSCPNKGVVTLVTGDQATRKLGAKHAAQAIDSVCSLISEVTGSAPDAELVEAVSKYMDASGGSDERAVRMYSEALMASQVDFEHPLHDPFEPEAVEWEASQWREDAWQSILSCEDSL